MLEKTEKGKAVAKLLKAKQVCDWKISKNEKYQEKLLDCELTVVR